MRLQTTLSCRARVPAQFRLKGHIIAHIDDLMDKVDTKFHLVHLSAKRAREINNYFAHLGEGLGHFVPPLMSADSSKPLSIALEEIAHRKVVPSQPVTTAAEDPLAFIEGDGDEIGAELDSET